MKGVFLVDSSRDPSGSSDSLEVKRLRTLIQAGETLCSTLDLSEVLNRILDFVTRELRAERSTLYLLEEESGGLVSLIAQGLEGSQIRLEPGEGVAGYVARTGDVVTISNAYDDPRFNPEVDRATGFQTSSVLTIPLKRGEKITGVLQVLNRREGQFDDADEEYLLGFGSLVAMAVENARLHQEEMELQRVEMEKQHLENELRTARSIQEEFLPREAPVLEGIDVAGANLASEHVSGDYFDFLLLGEDRLGLVVADVSGHGIPAAILMSMIRAVLRGPGVGDCSPGERLAQLNELLYDSTDETRFATMFLGLLDVRNKRLCFGNGGHLPPILIRETGKVETLPVGGLVLGILEGVSYEEKEVILGTGDVLLLFTDGVIECHRGESEEEFGEERLISLVMKHLHRSAQEITDIVLDALKDFHGGKQPEDDVTLITLKVG